MGVNLGLVAIVITFQSGVLINLFGGIYCFIHCGVFVLFVEASQLALLTLFEACITQS